MNVRIILLAAVAVVASTILIAHHGENAVAQSVAGHPVASEIASPPDSHERGVLNEVDESTSPRSTIDERRLAIVEKNINGLRSRAEELFNRASIPERERAAIEARIALQAADWRADLLDDGERRPKEGGGALEEPDPSSSRPRSSRDASERQCTADEMLAFWHTANSLSSSLSSPEQRAGRSRRSCK